MSNIVYELYIFLPINFICFLNASNLILFFLLLNKSWLNEIIYLLQLGDDKTTCKMKRVLLAQDLPSESQTPSKKKRNGTVDVSLLLSLHFLFNFI